MTKPRLSAEPERGPRFDPKCDHSSPCICYYPEHALLEQRKDCVIVSDITEIITASLDWRAGSDDIADAVDAWEQTGLCVEKITAWVEAGCFDAASAFGLSDAGFSAAECAQQARTGETIAYSFCNGDIELEGARLIISGELAEASHVVDQEAMDPVPTDDEWHCSGCDLWHLDDVPTGIHTDGTTYCPESAPLAVDQEGQQ